MSDELFLHSDALPEALPAFTPQNWTEHGYLRSEHETFTKLPKTGAVVFSIRICLILVLWFTYAILVIVTVPFLIHVHTVTLLDKHMRKLNGMRVRLKMRLNP